MTNFFAYAQKLREALEKLSQASIPDNSRFVEPVVEDKISQEEWLASQAKEPVALVEDSKVVAEGA